MLELGLLPNLKISGMPLGRNQAPLELTRLLFKGGTSTHVKRLESALRNGEMGPLLQARLELVVKLHEVIDGKMIIGGSPDTARTQVRNFHLLFGWADENGHHLDLHSIQSTYLRWTDELVHRQQVRKDLKQSSAYTQGRTVGQVLDSVLGRETPMIELTRLREPKGIASAQGVKAEKQNLEETFALGRLLQDICDGLPLSTVWGPKLIRIPLQNGVELVRGEEAESVPGTLSRTPEEERRLNVRRAWRRANFEKNRSVESRAGVINLRILAELLMFIGQTGLNLAQANILQIRHFSYSSDIDGYKVRDYKARRGGEVLFEIFKEYRSHFERYLEWRRALFPEDVRLFPLIKRNGAHEASRPWFGPIQNACRDAGVRWLPPSALRSTRVNWLLRRSGDADLTAAMAQHRKQTLVRVYEVPSLQRSIGEITRFWENSDPTLATSLQSVAVAPGTCDGKPLAVPFKPIAATAPDCTRPSGCLWCEHHRDIDSFDYVWALGSFRYLKTIEASRYHPPAAMRDILHPSDLAISRISEKLTWFRDSNATRREWVDETLARIEEGSFHPDWAYLISAVEGP